MPIQAAEAGDLMSVSKELKGEFHHLENGVRGLKRYNNLNTDSYASDYSRQKARPPDD